MDTKYDTTEVSDEELVNTAMKMSEPSLQNVWKTSEDDIYNAL